MFAAWPHVHECFRVRAAAQTLRTQAQALATVIAA
jgi:hypothetical protein